MAWVVDTCLLIDIAGADPTFGVPPEERHARGGNQGYIDGHVGYHRWRHTPKSHSPATGLMKTANAADAADMRVIIEGCPTPDRIDMSKLKIP